MDLSKLHSNKNLKVDLSDTYKPKSILIRFLLGMCMGVSDAVPGYSGGTTLSITNVYDQMIITAKNILKPENGNNRWKCFLWMIPFGFGWIGMIIASSIMLKHMLYDWNMQSEVLVFFAGLCLFNILTFSEVNRLNEKNKLRKNKKLWIYFSMGLILILSVSIVIWSNGGIAFGLDENPPIWNWKKHTVLLIISAYFGGMIMLIPGGSGSMLIFIMGMYDILHTTLLADPFKHVPELIIFWVAVFAGMATSIFFSSFLLRYFKDQFSMFSLGMIVSSVFAVLFIVNPEAYAHIGEKLHIIGVIISIFLSLLISIFVWQRARKANIEHIIESNEANIIKDIKQREINN